MPRKEERASPAPGGARGSSLVAPLALEKSLRVKSESGQKKRKKDSDVCRAAAAAKPRPRSAPPVDLRRVENRRIVIVETEVSCAHVETRTHARATDRAVRILHTPLSSSLSPGCATGEGYAADAGGGSNGTHRRTRRRRESSRREKPASRRDDCENDARRERRAHERKNLFQIVSWAGSTRTGMKF